jgi:hypothetical protein
VLAVCRFDPVKLRRLIDEFSLNNGRFDELGQAVPRLYYSCMTAGETRTVGTSDERMHLPVSQRRSDGNL